MRKGVELLVLLVEISEIDHQIFDDKHVRKRSDGSWFASIGINRLEACYCVNTIYVHCAWSAYTFSTWPPVTQTWILLSFYLLQCIQNLQKWLLNSESPDFTFNNILKESPCRHERKFNFLAKIFRSEKKKKTFLHKIKIIWRNTQPF